MRPIHATLVLAAALLPRPAGGDTGFTLHEWGTFTTVAGSDGVLLDGVTAEDEALPSFVHSRDREATGFAGASLKMETPVIYIRSEVERDVSVGVHFPGGILTHWYPQVRWTSPSVAEEAPALKDGRLSWQRIKVLAPGLGTEHLPPVGPDDPWAYARLPDANVLRVCHLPGVEGGMEWERYLFYRGLGRLTLPVSVAIEGAAGERTVVLRSEEPLAPELPVRLLRVEGGRISTALMNVSGSERGFNGRALRVSALVNSTVDEVASLLVQELAGQGLTVGEARAMVMTWKKSWLGSPGLRVLLPLPRKVTDALLPLQVDPEPRESVRVLVARMDILTPEDEARAVRVARTAADGKEAREALGRFAGPILRRAAATVSDPDTRTRAEALARALEPLR